MVQLSVSAAAALVRYRPLGHVLQLPLPGGLDVPVGQSVQRALPVLLLFPAAQVRHWSTAVALI